MQISKAFIPFMLAVLAAGIMIGFSFRSCSRTESQPDPIQIHDTIHISDTIVKEKIRTIYRTKSDTFVVCQHDSIRDTIWIEMPIDHNIYADRIKADSGIFDLAIKYSGYRASLDSIGISYHADLRPSVIEKKRGFGQFVGIGLGVGYGGSVIGNRVYASPYVGVHVTYGFGYIQMGKRR